MISSSRSTILGYLIFSLGMLLAGCSDTAPKETDPSAEPGDMARDAGQDASDTSPGVDTGSQESDMAPADVASPSDVDVGEDVSSCEFGLASDGGCAGPCDGFACPDHGECVLEAGSPTCECDPGYIPGGDDTCIPTCPADACGNHGECIEGGPELQCDCEPGYAAENLDCTGAGWFTDDPAGCQVGSAVDLVETTGLAEPLDIVKTDANEFAVVWIESFDRVLLSIFDGSGTEILSPVEFTDSNDLDHDVDDFAVAVSGDRVLVLWTHDDFISTGNNSGFRRKRLHYSVVTTSGVVVADDTILQNTAGETSLRPNAVGTPSGFAVAWVEGGAEYFAQMDTSGTLIGSPVELSSTQYTPKYRPALVWTGQEIGVLSSADSTKRLHLSRFTPAGAPIGSPVDVGDPSTDPSSARYGTPEITFTDGKYVLFYRYRERVNGVSEHVGTTRVFDPSTDTFTTMATPITEPSSLISTAPMYPSLLPQGSEFLFAHRIVESEEEDRGIMLARVSSDLQPNGAATVVRPDGQVWTHPHLIELSSGTFLVANHSVKPSDWDIRMTPVQCP